MAGALAQLLSAWADLTLETAAALQAGRVEATSYDVADAAIAELSEERSRHSPGTRCGNCPAVACALWPYPRHGEKYRWWLVPEDSALAGGPCGAACWRAEHASEPSSGLARQYYHHLQRPRRLIVGHIRRE